MKAKEKAEELCFKFQGDFHLNWTMSKRCALISVDDIIKECYRWTGQGNGQWENGRLEYWERVKYEINKL